MLFPTLQSRQPNEQQHPALLMTVSKGRCAAVAAANVARCWPPKCSSRKKQTPQHLPFKLICLFQIAIDEYEFSCNLLVNNVCEKRRRGLSSPKSGWRKRSSSHLPVSQMSQHCPGHSRRVKALILSHHLSPCSRYPGHKA